MNYYTMELIATTQKSYYGKAVIISNEKGVFLKSYNTIVCGFVGGKFKRFWNDYSVTTMKHVNDFIKLFGMDAGGKGKKWWMSQKVYDFEEV